MKIDNLVQNIRKLEGELDQVIDEHRQQFKYVVKNKRVEFEKAIRQRHLELRTGLSRYLYESGILALVFAPVVYSLFIPLVLLDIFTSVYQFLCFPVYGIRKVKRSDHIALDRHHLAYLNALEKLNCVYCGYANGLLSYVREIAGRSEAHWCPIKHARRVKGPHPHYWSFSDYGDAESYAQTGDKTKTTARNGKS